MAKRAFLSPIVNLGGEIGVMATVLRDGENTRATIPGTTAAQLIATGPNGLPVVPWAMVFADFADLAGAMDVPGVYCLPDYPLDGKVSGMHTATKNAMLTAFAARGIPTDFVQNADGFREVIRTVGRILEPSFDENVGSYAI